MLSKLKIYALGILSILATLFFALFSFEKAKAAKKELAQVKLGKKAQERAAKALVDGLEEEQKVKNETPTDDEFADRFYG